MCQNASKSGKGLALTSNVKANLPTFQGLLYAQQIQHLVRTVMNLHVAMQKPMVYTSKYSI